MRSLNRPLFASPLPANKKLKIDVWDIVKSNSNSRFESLNAMNLKVLDLRARGYTAKDVNQLLGYDSNACHEAVKKSGVNSIYQLMYVYGKEIGCAAQLYDTLTVQECECIHYLREGLTLGEISEELYVTQPRVSYIINQLVKKFKATNKHNLMFIVGVIEAFKQSKNNVTTA